MTTRALRVLNGREQAESNAQPEPHGQVKRSPLEDDAEVDSRAKRRECSIVQGVPVVALLHAQEHVQQQGQSDDPNKQEVPVTDASAQAKLGAGLLQAALSLNVLETEAEMQPLASRPGPYSRVQAKQACGYWQKKVTPDNMMARPARGVHGRWLLAQCLMLGSSDAMEDVPDTMEDVELSEFPQEDMGGSMDDVQLVGLSQAVRNLKPEFIDAILSSSKLLMYHSQALFLSYDRDADGKLTLEELEHFMPHVFSQLGLGNVETTSLLENFAASDLNHDGLLTHEEFITFVKHVLQEAREVMDL